MSRPSVRSLLAFLPVLFVLVIAIPNARAAAPIRGRVADAAGRAVAGARVIATGEGPLATVVTDGRGEFLSEELFDGRPILVRFVISDITATSCRFEQAFSDDNGASWEVNWIAIDTRRG